MKRGYCKKCTTHYKNKNDDQYGIYKREDGRWCCKCSGCGKEQAYTRKDHAKTSAEMEWVCHKCAMAQKKFQNLGQTRTEGIYSKYQRCANSRKIPWNITREEMVDKFTGRCNLTGWVIEMGRAGQRETASLDRIDSSKGYDIDNIQWVHSMVNMSKNKYDQNDFLYMCASIVENLNIKKHELNSGIKKKQEDNLQMQLFPV